MSIKGRHIPLRLGTGVRAEPYAEEGRSSGMKRLWEMEMDALSRKSEETFHRPAWYWHDGDFNIFEIAPDYRMSP